MKITSINDYKDIHQEKGTVLVLGYFDALHRGHKVLFDKARQIADDIQMISFCILQHLKGVVIFLKPMEQISFI